MQFSTRHTVLHACILLLPLGVLGCLAQEETVRWAPPKDTPLVWATEAYFPPRRTTVPEELLVTVQDRTRTYAERAKAARSIGTFTDRRGLDALRACLFELEWAKRAESHVLRIACANALLWSAIDNDEKSLRALWDALAQGELGMDVCRAVAKVLVDSRGGDEILATVARALRGERSDLVFRPGEKNCVTVSAVWSHLEKRIWGFPIGGYSKFGSRVQKELAALSGLLLKWSPEERGEFFREWGRVLLGFNGWVQHSPEGLDQLYGILRNLSPKDVEAKAAIVQCLEGKRGIVDLSILSPESVGVLLEWQKQLPPADAEVCRRVLEQVCHGRNEDIAARRITLSDAAMGRLLELVKKDAPVAASQEDEEDDGKRTDGKGDGRKCALTNEEWGVLCLVRKQLGRVSAKDESVLPELMGFAERQRISVNLQPDVGDALVEVFLNAPSAVSAKYRERLFRLLDRWMAGIPLSRDAAGAADVSYTSLASSRFRLLEGQARMTGLKEAQKTLHVQTLNWAIFLKRVAYDATQMREGNPDKPLVLLLAREIVEHYARTRASESSCPQWKQACNLLRMARASLSPEMLEKEAPTDLMPEYMEPGWSIYVDPQEWRAWYERYRKLPVFEGVSIPDEGAKP